MFEIGTFIDALVEVVKMFGIIFLESTAIKAAIALVVIFLLLRNFAEYILQYRSVQIIGLLLLFAFLAKENIF